MAVVINDFIDFDESMVGQYTIEDGNFVEFADGVVRLKLQTVTDPDDYTPAYLIIGGSADVGASVRLGSTEVTFEFRAPVSGVVDGLSLYVRPERNNAEASFWIRVDDDTGTEMDSMDVEWRSPVNATWVQRQIPLSFGITADDWYTVRMKRSATGFPVYVQVPPSGDGTSLLRKHSGDGADTWFRLSVRGPYADDRVDDWSHGDASVRSVMGSGAPVFGVRFKPQITGLIQTLGLRLRGTASTSNMKWAVYPVSENTGQPDTSNVVVSGTFAEAGVDGLVNASIAPIQQFTLDGTTGLIGGKSYAFLVWNESGGIPVGVSGVSTDFSIRDPAGPDIQYVEGTDRDSVETMVDRVSGRNDTPIRCGFWLTLKRLKPVVDGMSYWVQTPAIDGEDMQQLRSVHVFENTPSGCSIRWVVSFDGGTTWSRFNGSNWRTVDFPGDLTTLGMVAADMASLTVSDWMSPGGFTPESNVAFACALTSSNPVAVPSVDQITVVFDDAAVLPPDPVSAINVQDEGSPSATLTIQPEWPLERQRRHPGHYWETDDGYHSARPRFTKATDEYRMTWVLDATGMAALRSFFGTLEGPLGRFYWTPPGGVETAWHMVGEMSVTKLAPNAYRCETTIEEVMA